MKNVFPILIDSLFLLFASFVISIFILNYFLPHPYYVVISLTISALISLFSARFFLSLSNKKLVKKEHKKLYNDTLIRINLMKKEDLVKLIISAMQIKQATNLKNGFYDNETDTLYIVKFGFENLTKADVVRAFNLNEKNVVFLCQDYDQDIIDFAKRFNGKITLKDGKYLFNLLKENTLLPNNDFSAVYNEENKPIFKKQILKKKNAKKFLFFGVMFCFFSWFVPYKIYYVSWGILMISFSIYLKFFGKITE